MRIQLFPRYKLIVLSVLAISLYFTLMVCIKLWLYPGWTWKGYIGDFKAIVGLVVGLSVPIGFVWKARTRKTPNETLVAFLQRDISDPLAGTLSLAISVVTVGIWVAIVVFGEAIPSSEFLDDIDSYNWDSASAVLKNLSSQPLKWNVSQTLTTYDSVNHALEAGLLDGKSATEFTRFRADSRWLLEHGRGLDPLDCFSYYMSPLNALSYAEASKAIFLSENGHAVPEVRDAENRLLHALHGTWRRYWRAALLEKNGELLLATQDYEEARKQFQAAMLQEKDAQRKAILTGFIANTLAAQGRAPEAAELYKQVELAYPDPRKYIFHSNLGFFYLQAQEYQKAIDQIMAAIDLNGSDWISYLNLALVYDAENDYDDAEYEYKQVYEGAKPSGTKPNNLTFRECLILWGRTAEMAGKAFEVFAAYYLEASGGPHSSEAIQRLKNSPKGQRALYNQMSLFLRDTGTEGIDSYIKWFADRGSQMPVGGN